MPKDEEKQDELDLLSVLDPQKAFADDDIHWKKSHGNSKYRPEFCEGLTEFMAYGHTFAGACGRLGVTKSSGDRYTRVYPEFAEARELGEQLRLYRLERVLNYSATGEAHPLDEQKWMEIVSDRNLNFQALMFSLKTVHRDQYSEKIITEDVRITADVEKSQEVLNDEIKKQLDILSRSIGEGRNLPAKIGDIESTSKT